MPKRVELFHACPSGKRRGVVRRKASGNFANLLSRFARAVDDLGMPAAQRPVMVECGKRQVFKRERSQAGEGLGNGDFAIRDGTEEGC